MPEIRMRLKYRITLPASLVRQANIKLDDKLAVTYVNGSIILTPKLLGEQNHSQIKLCVASPAPPPSLHSPAPLPRLHQKPAQRPCGV